MGRNISVTIQQRKKSSTKLAKAVPCSRNLERPDHGVMIDNVWYGIGGESDTTLKLELLQVWTHLY
jgi:hypothetical protein